MAWDIASMTTFSREYDRTVHLQSQYVFFKGEKTFLFSAVASRWIGMKTDPCCLSCRAAGQVTFDFLRFTALPLSATAPEERRRKIFPVFLLFNPPGFNDRAAGFLPPARSLSPFQRALCSTHSFKMGGWSSGPVITRRK